jgi:beta-phosphoglucomutase
VPRAFLFDLDGTLIDSMPLHEAAWKQWHVSKGLPFDDAGFFAATAGRTNAEILSGLFPGHSEAALWALAEEKEALYRATARTQLQMIHGFEPLHARARHLKFPLAICTASPLGNMQVAFERFGLDAMVDTVLSPADGLPGKPEPHLFLEAARRLNMAPQDCIVFEDAPLGVEAARRAGMRAVALTTTLSAAHFQSFPNLIACVPDLAAVDSLQEVFHA